MWFFYALFFAVWSSFATLIVKRVTREIDPATLTFILLIFGVVSSFFLLQFVGGIPYATLNFYLFMFCSAVLDSVAFVSSFKAVKLTDISLLAPISSFGPVFTTFIAVYTLNEIPTPVKFSGILLVVIGSYLLNVSEIRGGMLAPFKKLFSNRGVLLFLLANLLWAITPIFQKKAILETSPQIPLYASVTGMFFASFILAPFVLRKALSYRKQFPKYTKWFGIYGVGTAFSQAAAYTAFALANVGYVTTVMRLSGVLTIILGGAFLKEKRIMERFLGALVMLLGALVIAL